MGVAKELRELGDDFFELYGGQEQNFLYDVAAKDYGRLSIIWGERNKYF